MTERQSIFQQYYTDNNLYDRYNEYPDDAVDVIIPIIHTNELWEANLYSIYREIPVKRLLISDGGCIDNSLDILKKFPRVEIYNHHEYKSLGYCLRELILNVNTEWFIYLHSDVYLPQNWFEPMKKHQPDYDWFGCPQRITVMAEYDNVDKMAGEVRPHAGSQMGRKQAFLDSIKEIDDDFVYRQEDLVLANIINKNGYKSGNVEDIFHYHQVMHKQSPWSRQIKKVSVEVEWSDAETIRASTMQIKGIVKYLTPSATLQKEVVSHIVVLKSIDAFNDEEFMKWVKDTSLEWVKYINLIEINFKTKTKKIIKKFIDILKSFVRKNDG